ncbi:MAG: carotenoid biosynthesis protein [Ignavibacteria bacterium]
MERKNFKKLIIFILLMFYSIGVLIHFNSYFTDSLKILTPLFLLFTSLLVLFEDKPSPKFLIWFLLSYTLTTIIEIIGVKTGQIFGQYQYNENLGIKIFEVPLIIGLNWMILVIAAIGFVEVIKASNIFKSFLSGLIMVSFDLLLEIAAPRLNYWNFINGHPPFQNYFAWFLISFFLSYLFFVIKINRTFLIARFNLIFQFIFFLLIILGR